MTWQRGPPRRTVDLSCTSSMISEPTCISSGIASHCDELARVAADDVAARERGVRAPRLAAAIDHLADRLGSASRAIDGRSTPSM